MENKFKAFEKRGTTPSGYDQCSADTSMGSKPMGKGADAVKAQDKSRAPRSFNKGAGSGANAVDAQAKTEAPRSFSKGSGYDGSQPCENQLNKRPHQM